MYKLSMKAIIISLYCPPDSKLIWFEHFSDLLLKINAMSCPIFALGDLNADLLTPSAFHSLHFLKAFSIGGIGVKNIFPTRITQYSSTCLDLIGLLFYISNNRSLCI